MNTCPVCGSQDNHKHGYPGSPYWLCDECDLLFQNPLPPKRFEAIEEKGADGRSKGHTQNPKDLEVAAHLARCWHRNHLSSLGKDKLRTLDIGAKYPYFAHILKTELNCDAWALDAMDQDSGAEAPIVWEYQKALGVPMLLIDFEKETTQGILQKIATIQETPAPQRFHGVSMIHVFEHIYDPMSGLQRLYELLEPGGKILLRMPDHRTDGYETHLNPQQYQIHPYYYSLSAFLVLLREFEKKTGINFLVYETYPLSHGVRDYLLTVTGA